MQRGEIWWANLYERSPVVVLDVGAGDDIRTILIVPSGGEKARAITIEVELEVPGLPDGSVVRVVPKQEGRVFCSWLATFTATDMVERVGMLSAETLGKVDAALAAAGLD